MWIFVSSCILLILFTKTVNFLSTDTRFTKKKENLADECVRLPIGHFFHIQPVGCSISLIYSGNRESCAFVVNTWNWGHNYLWASCIGSVSLLILFPVALEPQTRWQLHLLHLTYTQLLKLQRDILIVWEKEKIEKTTTKPKGRAADREALLNHSI